MEQENMKYSHSCNCGDCKEGMMANGHWGRRHIILRWILGFVIIMITFSLGEKIGMLRAELGDYGGYGMHDHYDGNRGDRMMYQEYSNMPMHAAVPTTSAVAPKQ